jgi:hypothetical protein
MCCPWANLRLPFYSSCQEPFSSLQFLVHFQVGHLTHFALLVGGPFGLPLLSSAFEPRSCEYCLCPCSMDIIRALDPSDNFVWMIHHFERPLSGMSFECLDYFCALSST